MSIIKVVLLAISGVLLAIQFKSGKQEYGIYMGIGISLIIFYQICEYLELIKQSLGVLQETFAGNREYLEILLKITGIAYVSEFGAGLCKDAGYQAMASQVEMFGKVTVLLSGMPVVLALMDMITGLLN